MTDTYQNTTEAHRISPYVFPGVFQIIEIELIIETVAAFYGIAISTLSTITRDCRVVRARYVCWLMIRRFSKAGLKRMGKLFGKDHTTVIHGLRTIQNDMETDSRVNQEVVFIAQQLKQAA